MKQSPQEIYYTRKYTRAQKRLKFYKGVWKVVTTAVSIAGISLAIVVLTYMVYLCGSLAHGIVPFRLREAMKVDNHSFTHTFWVTNVVNVVQETNKPFLIYSNIFQDKSNFILFDQDAVNYLSK